MARPPTTGRLKFLPDDVDAPFSPGESVLFHAVRAGVPILSPCGGEGRCGKCRVVVSGPTRGGNDPGVLSREEICAGVRLACRCVPLSPDAPVTVLPESRPARLAAWIAGTDLAGDDEPFLPLYALPAKGRPLGVALDLGTSTLAGALVDLADGSLLARASGDNPQMPCGEDLISRIVFAEENDGGLDLLRGMLAAGIEQVVDTLAGSAPEGGEIVDVTAAGNTVISHILYGLSPAPIRRPPYLPVRKEYPPRTGAELDLPAPAARWRIFPSIGGFVGGDIVAGILASGMCRDEAVSLFFDVGTNGEVALGNRDWRIACSSSAGPAFEGGEVACGMRAYPGAIESVSIPSGCLAAEFTVIGGGRPAGLCGSGILDLCAALFRAGLLDRAGRFVHRVGAPFRETERGEAYVVAGGDVTATGRPIAFAVQDVKSVLRTKAALCAAAESLLLAVGLSRDAVERVYIAGGFGNFIDLRSALTLGVFPPFPVRKFVPLGNASLAGAIGALRSRKRWKEAVAAAAATSYHDLSSDDGFMESYQRALFIPHTEEESYRMVLSPEAFRR